MNFKRRVRETKRFGLLINAIKYSGNSSEIVVSWMQSADLVTLKVKITEAT